MSYNILNEGYLGNKILFDKAKGSKIFLKKKNLIDLSMCAGSILLGHNHPILQKSLKNCLKQKISNTAAPNLHANKFVLSLKKIIPNSDKIIFCNSGTEAVIKSLRIARAITKKEKIVYVAGGWHGSVDQLLFKPNKKLKPIEISSGLTNESAKNLIILPYNNIKRSLSILKKDKKKISCIIIEPVQASLPYTNIKDYLKFLEKFSNQNNIPLIFDEMITGLRTNCSSVQKYYNIKPDISIFGKCFGGGLPIGFISISKKTFLKISRLNKKIFFGGTFSANSIITFTANQVLKYIIKNKKRIFKNLENKSIFFEKSLNSFFELNNLDLKIYRFHSMLRLVYSKNDLKDRPTRDFFEQKKSTKISKFKKFLFSQKIHYASSGIIFLSYAHSKKDLNYVIKQFKIGLKKYF